MSRSAMDQLRDANPVPTTLPAPPIEPILAQLDTPPAPHSGPGARDGRRSARHRLGRPAAWVMPIAGVLITIAVVVAALTLLGRTHRPPVAGEGPAVARPSSTRTSGSVVPAGEYAFAVGGDANAAGGRVLSQAEQVLRQRCMRQRGFRYMTLAPPARSPLPSATGYPSTFYPQPLPNAYPESELLTLRQREGFGITSSAAAAGRDPDPNDRYLKTLSPAQQRRWRAAWMGHNGCYGWAEVQLFGSRRAAALEQLLPTQIYDQLNTAVYAPDGTLSPTHRATYRAAAAWSRCMRTATGTGWPDENALITWLTSPPQTTRSSARQEINLAVADTRCAYSTGQARTFATAFRRAARHLAPATAAQLGFLLAHRSTWIHKADRIVASASGGG